jgi:hypothetical protein
MPMVPKAIRRVEADALDPRTRLPENKSQDERQRDRACLL